MSIPIHDITFESLREISHVKDLMKPAVPRPSDSGLSPVQRQADSRTNI